jgi:phosphoribosylaminoimidazole-succinocarboxamide synthase
MPAPILDVQLPFPKVRSGKVREMFDLGDALLMVASDRISAFDCIMPNGIPDKGRVLTQTSLFWFHTLAQALPHHVIAEWSDVADRYGVEARVLESANLDGRALVVRKTSPLPIECVVRGYISGSLWKEYQAATSEAGPGRAVTLHGYELPPGLRESDQLAEPIFTPATKAETGHDINIDFNQAAELVGEETAMLVRDRSLALYGEAAAFARKRGIIIADTKFEFGRVDADTILIDEILTPDSSRFWPADAYEPGRPQPSFDKQFLRDYLETLDWDKSPPAPALPEDIIDKTAAKYREAYERLTGTPLPPSGS